MFLRVRDYIRDRPELVAVTLEPLLMEDRWRGLWNVLSGQLAFCCLYLVCIYGFSVKGCFIKGFGCFCVSGLRALFCIVVRLFDWNLELN